MARWLRLDAAGQIWTSVEGVPVLARCVEYELLKHNAGALVRSEEAWALGVCSVMLRGPSCICLS